jgi:formate dehydrogenase major subunit
MTNSFGDIQNAKSIFIIGCNPAVNHPVGFGHILKAKERNNAKIIVIDPRFTKSAAKADYFAQIRPGTDIPFVYGMLHIIFKNGWEDKKYIEDRVYGMDEIRAEALKWTPEVVADVTGVSAETLMEITTVYAKNSPGTLL